MYGSRFWETAAMQICWRPQGISTSLLSLTCFWYLWLEDYEKICLIVHFLLLVSVQYVGRHINVLNHLDPVLGLTQKAFLETSHITMHTVLWIVLSTSSFWPAQSADPVVVASHHQVTYLNLAGVGLVMITLLNLRVAFKSAWNGNFGSLVIVRLALDLAVSWNKDVPVVAITPESTVGHESLDSS